MNGFDVAQDELLIGGIPITRLAERVGRTPFYAYDRGRIQDRVDAVRGALPSGVRLHYAVKANPMPALLGFLCPLVDGFDVASGGELALALDAGACADHVGFAGPGKSDGELTQAVASGVLVNLESFREVDVLGRVSARLGLPARVAVRVNPDFEVRGAGMRMGGGARPFGVDADQVPALLADIAAAGLAFEGFHLYPGSQVLKADLLAQTIERSSELVVRLGAFALAPVQHVNLGGGWGIPYTGTESELDLAPITQALEKAQERLRQAFGAVTTVVELGRYLVGQAGVYVVRVLDRKVSRGEVFLVTDGGLHHHLAASGNFGQVIRRNYPVAVANRMGGDRQEVVSVVGPLCTPLDVLAQAVPLPAAQPGDLVAVFQSGAYGASASPQGFLSHSPCREVLV